MSDAQIKQLTHAGALLAGTVLGYLVPGVPWSSIFAAIFGG